MYIEKGDGMERQKKEKLTGWISRDNEWNIKRYKNCDTTKYSMER